MVGQVAHRTGDTPLSQAVESALAEGRDRPLDGGPSQVGDGRGRLPGEPTVEHPQDEHLAADMGGGVGVTLGADDRFLGVGECDREPGHDDDFAWGCPGTAHVESLR